MKKPLEALYRQLWRVGVSQTQHCHQLGTRYLDSWRYTTRYLDIV